MYEVKHNGKVLAVIDSIANIPPGLGFYGTKDDYVQVGKFRYDKGKKLRDHRHITRQRVVWKTQEILIVMRGSVQATTFAETGLLVVDSRQVKAGEFYISYWGGVGFEVLEDDTRMLEIKPGPFNVTNDDEERELL
jgi:hypothetical protein